MARKRIIDPEFWSDEEIGQWSYAARLFYIGLWNFADDEGRFKAHNNLLRAQIFPYETRIDIDKLKKELNHKIQWYEVEGLQYGFIRNFLKYQRIDKPSESKLPIPPPFSEPSPNNQGILPPNISKEKLSKDKGAPHEIYEYYSKTIKPGAKEDAIKNITKLLKTVSKENLLGRIDAYKAQLKKEGTEQRFYIQANNFFGQKARYKDFEPLKKIEFKVADPNCKVCNGSGLVFMVNESKTIPCKCREVH